MNKLLLTSLFFLSLSYSRAQTSVYHPFPDSNAHWNISEYVTWGDYCYPFWYDNSNYWSYVIGGDTTIGANSFHKLNVSAYEHFSSAWCSPSGHYINPGYYTGCYRQDTALKKVYYVPVGDSAEQLLYDFSLAIGDTLKGYLVRTPWECVSIISNIDSVLIGSTYRKRWQTNDNWTWGIDIIEGIGCERGLLEPICEGVDDRSHHLDCFTQNDTTLFPYASIVCEPIVLNVPTQLRVNSLLISPNPSHDEFTVSAIGDLEIYNTLGEKVYHQTVNLKPQTLNPKLSPGIYLVTVTDGALLYRSKLIIN